jgi:hypothetical protein
VKLIWTFGRWMLSDVPGALRRSFWMAIIGGFLGGIYHKITNRSERMAVRMGIA